MNQFSENKLLNVRCLGGRVIHYPVIDSTNRKARELAERGEPEGTVVRAGKQTAGYGRQGKRWMSAEGQGAYISIILRPEMDPPDLVYIAMMAVVSITAMLRENGIAGAVVKPPNDVLVGDKKIAGVLVEPRIMNRSVQSCILGIGLNVRQSAEECAAVNLDQSITSCRAEGWDSSVEEVTETLICKLDQAYTQLKVRGGCQHLIKRWQDMGGGFSVPDSTEVQSGQEER